MKMVSVRLTCLLLLLLAVPVFLTAQSDLSELTDDQIIELQKQELYLITDIQAQQISIIKQMLVLRQKQLRERNERLDSQMRDENYEAMSDSEKVVLLRFLRENLDKTNEQLASTQDLLRRAQEIIDKRNAGQPVSDAELAAFWQGTGAVRYRENIHFALGSTRLDQKARRVLTEFADSLKNQEKYQLQIVGHTDNIPMSGKGRYASNWELSVARAVTVATYLINQQGLDPKNIIVGGKSEYDPLGDNSDREMRQNNRRVELILSP